MAAGAAAVVVVLMGTVAMVVDSSHERDQKLVTSNPSTSAQPGPPPGVPGTDNPETNGGPSTTTPQTTAPGPGGPRPGNGSGNRNGGSGPSGGSGGTGGGPPLSGSGSQNPSGGSTIPGATSTPAGGATTPSGDGTTTPDEAPSTTTPAPLTIDEVKDQISNLASSHPGAVRGLAEASYDLGGTGELTPVVAVSLRSDQIQLAGEIYRTWPGQTIIRLGFLPFGPGDLPVAPCGSMGLDSTPYLPPGFAATIAVSPTPVPSGRDFKGTLTIVNKGDKGVDFSAGGASTVTLYRNGTPVGCFDGAVSPTPIAGTIGPGASSVLPVIGGTASADGTLGFSVPRGVYTGLIVLTVGGNRVSVQFPVTVSK